MGQREINCVWRERWDRTREINCQCVGERDGTEREINCQCVGERDETELER